MADKYYIRGTMRNGVSFKLEFLTVEARTREMMGIVKAIQDQFPVYICYAEGRTAMLRLDRIDIVKEE